MELIVCSRPICYLLPKKCQTADEFVGASTVHLVSSIHMCFGFETSYLCVCVREREKERERKREGRLSDITTTSLIDTARGKTICHMLTQLLLMLDL